MKRRWNLWLWAGFLVAVVAVVSYFVLFCRFPITRDVPWANFTLFVVAGWLLVVGLKRAFQQPELYRGKVSGVVLGTLSVVIFGLFLFEIFYAVRQLPASVGAPRVGQRAPDFTLPDKVGKPVTLAALLSSPSNSGAGSKERTSGAVLIFYRGAW